MATALEEAVSDFMFLAVDLPFTPRDFVCPVCRDPLLQTPSKFYVCFDPNHTKLLGERQARAVCVKIFREESIAKVIEWQVKQLKENTPSPSDDPAIPGIIRTSIRGVYQIRADNRLFRVTRNEDLATLEAMRGRKLVMLRTLRPKEFVRYLRQGRFFARD